MKEIKMTRTEFALVMLLVIIISVFIGCSQRDFNLINAHDPKICTGCHAEWAE
jgi:hypothetical protein